MSATLTNWDLRFLDLASLIATWSKDRSTKVGAVIVGPHREIRSTGYNGFPPRVDDDQDSRHERPTKYLFTSHAEENAIAFAALNGVALQGCTMYSSMFPCATCARLIIRAGIKRIVAPEGNRADWQEQHEAARIMFQEASVSVHERLLDHVSAG